MRFAQRNRGRLCLGGIAARDDQRGVARQRAADAAAKMAVAAEYEYAVIAAVIALRARQQRCGYFFCMKKVNTLSASSADNNILPVCLAKA
jgi:hypothetical protein